VDDFRACAEVCESHGFVRQAEFFRSFAKDRCLVYVVIERENEFPEDDDSNEGGEPVAILLDRSEAEREADRRNLKAYREYNLIEICYQTGYEDLELITTFTIDELSERISEILGQAYRFPEDRSPPMPIFPPSATDDQMRRIIELFVPLFFSVRELELKV
jgi:hypothetical protein